MRACESVRVPGPGANEVRAVDSCTSRGAGYLSPPRWKYHDGCAQFDLSAAEIHIAANRRKDVLKGVFEIHRLGSRQ